MISAVCGRAPPDDEPPNAPPAPPLCPPTDQDSLSVTKTRAASVGAVVVGLSCATDATVRENDMTARKRDVRIQPPDSTDAISLPSYMSSATRAGKITHTL